MAYHAAETRYREMHYRRCGNSGLLLPALSLGLWHNFGHSTDYNNCRNIVTTAFDHGITHFDLANNYGPPPGSAEETFGKLLKADFSSYRDELIISTKAGYTMWPGPYGDWGSKKYLVSSLDQSLQRMRLGYVDIFYHHRPDPHTPLEETMSALALLVRKGKALYVGISNYRPEEAEKAITILRQLNTPCLIHQPKYSMFDRGPEGGLLSLLKKENIGCIPFSPLTQGLLTDKYLHGISADSRVATSGVFLKQSSIIPDKIEKIRQLNALARQRGQKLVHMALAWLLNNSAITSVLIGASKPEQVTDSMECLKNFAFSDAELNAINGILQ